MTIFADKPTLLGRLMLLRPFTPSDIDAMGPILADPEVLRLTGSVHSSEAAQRQPKRLDERALEWYRTRNEQVDRLDLAVVDRSTDRCVGEAVLNVSANPTPPAISGSCWDRTAAIVVSVPRRRD